MTCRSLAWTLFALSVFGASCNFDSRQLLARAEARWRQGNYEEAIQLNRLVYEREPQGRLAPQALFNIANISYLNLRRIKDAVQAYTRLADEFPGRPEEIKARLLLAGIYENEIMDLTQAVAEYDRLLETAKLDNRLEIQFKRANAYFKMEDYSRAVRELSRIEEAGATGHLADQVALKIGSIYLVQRKYEDAAGYFQKVQASPCPECRQRAIESLTDTYEAQYDIPRAIETIRKLDHTPENDRRVSEEVERLTRKQQRLEGGTPLPWQAQQEKPAKATRAPRSSRKHSL